jgi:hypothetical protein
LPLPIQIPVKATQCFRCLLSGILFCSKPGNDSLIARTYNENATMNARQCTALSALETAIFSSRKFSNSGASPIHIIKIFVMLFAVQYALFVIYNTFIYPFYRSPLRHLPGPKVNFVSPTTLDANLVDRMAPSFSVKLSSSLKLKDQMTSCSRTCSNFQMRQ